MTNIKSKLHIEFGIDVFDIVTTRRIGITRALDKSCVFVVGHG
jgi:3-methyladenine DNA glycosylase Mpg